MRMGHTLAIVALTLVGCSHQLLPSSTPINDQVLLSLRSTSATSPLSREITRHYAHINPNLSFDVTVSNYQRIIDDLMRERDFYFFTNHLPTTPETPLWAAPIGQDGIAIILHPEHPQPNLSIDQVRGIYQGRIRNWQEIGGADQEIHVISREEGAGTRIEFEQLVMGDRLTVQNAQIAPSSQAMRQSVARQVGSIGYVSMAYVDETIQAAQIEGITLSADTVYDNTYPLRTTLFVAGLEEPEGPYRTFVGWVQSPEGQAIIGQNYAPFLRP